MVESGADRLLAAPMPYRCRVCATERVIYVAPIEDDDGELVIDSTGKHRLATTHCGVCAQERTHAIHIDDVLVEPEGA